MAEPQLPTEKIQTMRLVRNTIRARFYKNCRWRSGEHRREWGTVCNPVDLSVVPEREDVRIIVSIFRVLFDIIADRGDSSVRLLLDLAICRRVVC